MSKIWSTVATFTTLFLLDLVIMTSTNESQIEVFNLARNRSEVPIFGLSLGSLFTVVSSSLMLVLIPHRGGMAWVDRVPPLWVDPRESERFRRAWKGFSLCLTAVFPLLAQLLFWFKFHHPDFEAWINDGADPPTQVSLYEPVSFLLVFDWDMHRYGDSANIRLPEGGGVSYLPFWQPILMGTLSLVSLVLTFAIFQRVLAGRSEVQCQ